MKSQSIISPEDQKVTFVELFFDLVFVFSITQIVTLLHHDLNGTAILRAVLIFLSDLVEMKLKPLFNYLDPLAKGGQNDKRGAGSSAGTKKPVH